MSRLQGHLCAAIAVTLLWGTASAHAANATEELRTSGPRDNRINIAVLGDGYTAAQQNDLLADATLLINGLLDTPPFSHYASWFNATLIHVESPQSGADHPENNLFRDTALSAGYNCNGIERLICINYTQTLAITAQAVPDYTFAIVLVNDSTYGGSGGVVAVASVHADALDIVRHELGHSFVDLADEYDAITPGYPACSSSADCTEPNVTLRNTREEIKWRNWIDANTPVPTPDNYSNVVGLFEGARYQPSGVYRPELNCKMRSLAAPFCRICTETLTLQFYDHVNPIDTRAPDSDQQLAWDETARLQILRPLPAPTTVSVQWFFDGVVQPGLNEDFLLLHASMLDSSLGSGPHVVEAVVHDATTAVLNPPTGHLEATASWRITHRGWCGDGLPNGPEICDDGGTNNTAACLDCLSVSVAGDDGAPSAGDSDTPPTARKRIDDSDEGCACSRCSGVGGRSSAQRGLGLALFMSVLAMRARRRRR